MRLRHIAIFYPRFFIFFLDYCFYLFIMRRPILEMINKKYEAMFNRLYIQHFTDTSRLGTSTDDEGQCIYER